MFEWFKQIFKTEENIVLPKTLPPIVITIHGYGRRRMHEFDNFANWGKKDGFEIIQFDMYDLFDERDHDWMHWVARAKDCIDSYTTSGRDIYLAGFSMGGVIAAYLATLCPIKKLILLAPAYSYVNMDMITGAITKSAASLWSAEKKEEIVLPRSFYAAFTELIKNLKKYIADVKCPVLMIHGDMDEVISLKSSLWAYDKIPHARKRLLILHGGHHRLLMDEKVNWECYQNMKLFLEGVLLPDHEIEQASDIMEELIQKKHELDALAMQKDEQTRERTLVEE